MNDFIGIIAGGGNLPIEIAHLCKSNKIGVCIAFVAQSEELHHITQDDFIHHNTFGIGEVGKILEFFTNHKVKYVTFAGKVVRPKFSDIKADIIGLKLLGLIVKQSLKGDDNLLKICANFVESFGFVVISPSSISNICRTGNNHGDKDSNAATNNKNNCCDVEPGNNNCSSDYKKHQPSYSNRSGYDEDNCNNNINPNITCTISTPSARDLIDIDIGVSVLLKLGDADVGQSIIVCDGYVLGIEAAEGTDNLIKRCSKLRGHKNGGVLVKTMKKSQDKRLDVPAIGENTIAILGENGFNGVAIHDKVIVINNESTIKCANKLGIFINIINITNI